MIPLIY